MYSIVLCVCVLFVCLHARGVSALVCRVSYVYVVAANVVRMGVRVYYMMLSDGCYTQKHGFMRDRLTATLCVDVFVDGTRGGFT